MNTDMWMFVFIGHGTEDEIAPLFDKISGYARRFPTWLELARELYEGAMWRIAMEMKQHRTFIQAATSLIAEADWWSQ